MLERALEVCARSLFRHVFILVEPTNRPAVWVGDTGDNRADRDSLTHKSNAA